MLTWISEQAKWVIYIFIVFIIAGLLFMDQASLQTNEIPPIAKVNGEKISAEQYATQLTARQRQSAGQQVSDADQARLRKEVFENMIQARLLNSQISELGIQASGFEMHKDMLLSPPPGIRQNPQFMTADSQFDPKKYEIWLATDSVYNSASMRQYENYLEKEKIPLMQLQSYIGASFHVSNLETEFSVARRENKAKFVVLSTSIDSFNVTDPTEAEVKAVFESKTDSFFIKEDLAKMNFISLAILPSVADEKNAEKFAQFLIDQIKDGADFAELATLNSEDKGSASKGGRLGFSKAESWVKPFAIAAFALEPGAISAPVKSQFGYHVLKLHEKKTENGQELADVSHILIKVTPGTETVDSLQSLARAIAEKVELGENFNSLAQESKIDVKASDWVSAREGLPGIGFLRGLGGYLFHNTKGSKISKVLDNDRFIVLAQKTIEIAKGTRNLERFAPAIETSLRNEKKMAAAIKYLSSLTLNESLAKQEVKVSLDSSQLIGLDSYLPKVGFGTAALQTFFNLNENEWSSVLSGDRFAIAAKKIETKTKEFKQIELMAKREKENLGKFATQAVFNEYMAYLKRSANVEDFFNLHYSE